MKNQSVTYILKTCVFLIHDILTSSAIDLTFWRMLQILKVSRPIRDVNRIELGTNEYESIG